METDFYNGKGVSDMIGGIMNGKKRIFSCGLSLVLTATAFAGLCGCRNTPTLAAKMYDFGDDYYKSVEKRYKLNYDEMIYDDFTGDDIDRDKWVVSDSVWDQWGTDQNGVRPQNLFLLDDPARPETHLIMRANGAYYDGDNGRLSAQQTGINTGASISTVEALGPGRYDVKMKPCPRVGALTSMWVFSWFNKDDGSVQQNEIDIEIGLKPDFANVFFTTWTSPSNNSNFAQPVDYMVNDGDWHVYSFDWVTDAEVPYVDYYIDGVKMMTIDTNVPTTNATLTLGIWVPSWAGGGMTDPVYNVSSASRMWESDYAEFSWWRYVPFQMDGWEQRPVTNRNYDPDYKVEKLAQMPTVNKTANGDFERADESYYYPEFRNNPDAVNAINLDTPWKDYTEKDPDSSFFVENSSAERIADATKDPATPDNYVAKIVNGGSFGQWLRGTGTGYKFRVKGKYRVEGNATAIFRYNNYLGFSTTSRSNGSETIQIGSATQWTDFSFEFTVTKPETQSIRYYLEVLNSAGTAYFDDIEMVYLGHN